MGKQSRIKKVHRKLRNKEKVTPKELKGLNIEFERLQKTGRFVRGTA